MASERTVCALDLRKGGGLGQRNYETKPDLRARSDTSVVWLCGKSQISAARSQKRWKTSGRYQEFGGTPCARVRPASRPRGKNKICKSKGLCAIANHVPDVGLIAQ